MIGYVLVGALAGYALLKTSDQSSAQQTPTKRDPLQTMSDWFNPGSQPQTGNGGSNTWGDVGATVGGLIGGVLGSKFWESGEDKASPSVTSGEGGWSMDWS